MFRGLQVFVSGIALAGFTLAGAAVASAQEAAKPVMTLDGEAAIITIMIKPDKTADFDQVLAKYKEALAKNDTNAARKTQLAGMKFYKGASTAQGVPYIVVVDPVVKGEEYDITRVITEVFPSEVQALYELYKNSFAGRGIAAVTKIQ